MLFKTIIILSFILITQVCDAQNPIPEFYKQYHLPNPDKRTNRDSIYQIQNDSFFLHKDSVIGFNMANWYRKQPESKLGNFMADCLMLFAEKIYNKKVDLSILNYGSIRSFLPQGDISIGHCYELMPFRNTIVLLNIDGNTLHQLLNLSASKGGWPLAGAKMTIQNDSAYQVMINDKILRDTAHYTIATVDYLANGGNSCDMLKHISRQDNHFLFRDALILYISSFTKAGKPITTSVENRVTRQE